jgi:2-oxoisovalerate dehydrogenase E1 component
VYPIPEILDDFRLACLSRQVSLITRREVMSGNAKFGAFGDGKELAQLAMARAFRPGDQRAGYYRDQTLALALGMVTPEQFFAQLYGHPDPAADPATAGRTMNAHFATRLLDDAGAWRPQTDRANSSADISPTAGQMPRLVGLAQASRLYRELPALRELTQFSRNGDEVAFGTIGNGSCAEGLFWEAVNAIGVLQVPAVVAVWDDGYGISVPNSLQLAKGDLSALLEGFRLDPATGCGFNLFTVRGWDYPALRAAFAAAAAEARERHVPAILHVVEMVQLQGHSTSGSHERYKPPERLAWERAHDPLSLMRRWMLAEGVAAEAQLRTIEREAKAEAEAARERAWEAYQQRPRALARELAALLEPLGAPVADLAARVRADPKPIQRTALAAAHEALVRTHQHPSPARAALAAWHERERSALRAAFGSHLHREDERAAARVPAVPLRYDPEPPELRGFEILQAAFDAALARDPRVLIFGEDVGMLGDVNQGVAGLQEKHGALRVADTGIREATIVGQAIGLALRGLRPIAEIQYLDYVYYALMALTDDLACLHWRTRGGQAAPVIIRTRGHRLEGVWHAGSPMGVLVNALRGMHILVPRDMTRAAGFYNTLLRAEEPALVVEVLNGYRKREPLPANLGDYCLPLGVPETLRPGDDITLVTYGACCPVALEAAEQLARVGVELEVIDAQSLLPFDTAGAIVASLRRTGRLLVLDEDVPGGASAFVLQQILERQGGYWQLDSPPVTVTAQPHRPAYTSDGDYASKPGPEDVFRAAYALMHEADPRRFPGF